MTIQWYSIADDLLGLWPTVCHGFVNEYFSVSRGVNEGGTAWLVFDYDYCDEVGPSTYASLAVPVAKLREDTCHLPTRPAGKIAVPVAAIPVAPQGPVSLNSPLAPTTIRSTWSLSVVLGPGGRVVACIAQGTRFARGVPSYPLPLGMRFRRALNKKGALSLRIDAQGLRAAHFPVDPWRTYL